MGAGKDESPEEQALNQQKLAFQANMFNRGSALASQPYESYSSGDRFAGFDAQETAAQGRMLNYAGTPAGYYNQAMGAVRPNLGFSGTFQKQAFDPATQAEMEQGVAMRMNPYTNQVIDATMGDYNRARQMANLSGASDATLAGGGAFGSTRHGVERSLTNEAFAREAGKTAGELRYAGYGQALGGYEQERARLQAIRLQQEGMSADDAARAVGLSGSQAALYASLGDLQDRSKLQRMGLQEQVGAHRRGLLQQTKDFDYYQWQQEQNLERENIAMMNAIASGNPYTPSPAAGTDPYAAAAGGAATGFAAGAPLGWGGAAAGTILGGWAGYQQARS